MRLAALTLAATLALSGAALAGDFADRRIVGFSPDGGTFAFEEYGVEDGSGFAYSNIYVIDTRTDSWVNGTPIRVRIEKDVDLLKEARADAAKKAAPILAARKVGEEGLHAASNPVAETSADPHSVRFKDRLPLTMAEEWELSLSEIQLPAAGCPDMGEPFAGFRLTLKTPKTNRVLTEDKSIPDSRKCPLRYGISDALVFHREQGGPVLVTLVNVFAVGFEGPNRRFLAVAETID